MVKVIEDDGFSVPAQGNDVDSLNALLEDVQFYEHWAIKHSRDTTLPANILELVNVKDKSPDQVKHANRLILQETYPTFCPQIKEETPATEASAVQK